ncbi:MAG: SPOR domain-containing protein [Deltaproteobacteria bacterium]|nr:SPOR domain-containing protein [Deltaproteobacteria bacterium]
MTDDPKRRQDDQVTQEDGRLVHELESIYRRVDSPDSPEVAFDIAENPDPYYKILQIHPNVSLSDIRLAYGRMTSAWDPERYPHVPSWKEKSTEKLKEIKNAYEKLLFLHAARETADPGDATYPPSSTALLSFPVNPDLEETAPVRANVNVFSRSTFKLRPWLLAPGALIAIILLLVLLWPTLYHYEAVRLEGKDYPLRINRLTTHTQYFDGRQWLEPPFRVDTPHNVPPEIASPPLPAQLTRAGIRNEPKPSSPPLTKQEITPPDRISVETKTRGPYSIQVSAYPARDKAEALAKEIQAKKFAIRVEAVSIPGKGQWYRVLLGQFENPDAALQYLKDHQIGETYPGSFIQKSVIHSK